MYKAAVIGCGRIGTEFDDKEMGYISTHASAYRYHPEVELVGLCDTDIYKLEEARRKFGIEEDDSHMSYKDMVAYAHPDIVSICTPANTHANILFNLVEMDAGISTIWCEKPIAKTTDEAIKMVQACEKRDINLFINYTRAFMYFYHLVLMYINKELGGVTRLIGSYSGGIFNNGTHMIDLMYRFGGIAKQAIGTFSLNSPGTEEDPNVDGMMVLQNGVTAVMMAYSKPIFELDIHCNGGKIRLANGAFDAQNLNTSDSEFHIPGDRERREPMLSALVNVVQNLKDGTLIILCGGYHGITNLKTAEILVASAKEATAYIRRE